RERQGPGWRDSLYAALKLHAGGHSAVPDVPSRRADLFHSNAPAGHDDLCWRFTDTAYLSQRAAFGQSEAVLVRRVSRTLRWRYARCRYHRAEQQDVPGQLSHSALREAARGGALEAGRR